MSDVETATVEAPAIETGLDSNQPVSVTIGDIELTGAGETEASLREGLPKAPEAKPEKPSKGRQRYSELTSERDQEREKRAHVERERDELQTRLNALSAPAQAPVREAPAPVSTAAPVSPKFIFPTYDAAQAQHPTLSWDDWNDEKIAARARWEYQQAQGDLETRIRSGIEADRASRAFADSVDTLFNRGRERYADFDAVRQTGPGVGIVLGPTADKGQERVQLITQLPNAEDVFYAIAKDARVAHALARMNDVQFGMALASIAPTGPAASPASTGSSGVSVPPPPMQPVGSGSKTTVPTATDLAERAGEDYDASGFREQLRRERGRR